MNPVELRVAIQRGLLDELGDAYDCTRVWSAWGYGTMGEDDFVPVLDRLEELIDAIVFHIADVAKAIEAEGRDGVAGSVHESAAPQEFAQTEVPQS